MRLGRSGQRLVSQTAKHLAASRAFREGCLAVCASRAVEEGIRKTETVSNRSNSKIAGTTRLPQPTENAQSSGHWCRRQTTGMRKTGSIISRPGLRVTHRDDASLSSVPVGLVILLLQEGQFPCRRSLRSASVLCNKSPIYDAVRERLNPDFPGSGPPITVQRTSECSILGLRWSFRARADLVDITALSIMLGPSITKCV